MLADFYLDNAGWIFLAAFIVISAALLPARRHLSTSWWAGSLAAGVVMIALTTALAVILQEALDPGGGVSAEGLLAIGFAGVLGFIAATDVQLAWGLVRGERMGNGPVVAGAVIGPMIVVAGYQLLNRSTEWVR